MASNDTLVYRLRSSGKRMPESAIDGGKLLTEAADRIEWLEKECKFLHERRGDLVIKLDHCEIDRDAACEQRDMNRAVLQRVQKVLADTPDAIWKSLKAEVTRVMEWGDLFANTPRFTNRKLAVMSFENDGEVNES